MRNNNSSLAPSASAKGDQEIHDNDIASTWDAVYNCALLEQQTQSPQKFTETEENQKDYHVRQI